MPNLALLQSLTIIILIALVVIAAILYWKEHKKRRQIQDQMVSSSLGDARKKSYNILHKAMQKAQSIIGKAELEGVEVVASSKINTRKFEEKYETEFSKQVSKAQDEFIRYLQDLRTQGQQAELLSQEFTKQKVNEIFEKFEQNLASFLTQTEQKSVSAIDLELKATRQLIDTYKTQQLALIDENVIAMLEKTLSLVLVNKITLKDEVDLVYEALEKAKAEKFIN